MSLTDILLGDPLRGGANGQAYLYNVTEVVKVSHTPRLFSQDCRPPHSLNLGGKGRKGDAWGGEV